MLTLPAFILAIGLLIAIHEYGHYRMAVACGVKVLRFSIGFGKPLWRRQRDADGTEFVLALFPLGGYVKMLDEREGSVAPDQRHLAFNTQSVGRRAAIVVAGPLANLLLAVFLYALVNWVGVALPQPILSAPVAGSLAERAGLKGGERVLQVLGQDGDAVPLASFDELRWTLTRSSLEQEDVRLRVDDGQGLEREVGLPLSELQTTQIDADLFNRIGVVAPLSRPLLGELEPSGAAARSGLRKGDEVQAIDALPVQDGQQLRRLIRASGQAGPVAAQTWQVVRDGQVLLLQVTPDRVTEGEQAVGRIGAYVGAPPAMGTVRYGPLEGLWLGLGKTWEVSTLTLKMMGRMLIGEASVKNISGPLTIADYAGRSAGMGLAQYLVFLALVSVSLGVLNLLPLPVLDGGHLMYYLWEWATGRPVSESWMERLQRGGMALLAVMMTLALFNDVNRLLG